MSQITRCPHCQTRFKVVDDQLRISDGWVRCGKCKSVFDARTHLVQRSEDAPAAAEVPTPAMAPAAVPTAVPTAVPNAATTVGMAPAGAPVAPAGSVARKEAAQPAPSEAPLAAMPAAAAAVVTVTGNSVAVDPPAHVPELSVLVFPRRAGFGESGYVDSSWMSAYDEAPAAALPPSQAPVPAADSDTAGLESEWQPAQDQRPEAVRKSSADFSAHDDLAELHAREGRLLDAIAEKKARAETRVQEPKRETTEVLQPAPAPVVGQGSEAAPEVSAAAEAASATSEDQDAASSAPGEPSEAPAVELPPQVAEPAAASKRSTDDDEEQFPPSHSASLSPSSQKHESAAELDVAAAPQPLPEAASAELDEPGFVRAAKRKAFWSQPAVVLASTACAVLLTLVLVLQVALAQRDQLAVQFPQARPALEKLCQVAGCQLALPRELQFVAIDSTGFQPLGPNQFQLTVVLRNAAAHAVAVPALELSLNDAAEKLVLRRVLSTADMQAPAQLPARGEWTAVVPLQVAQGSAVVGYRVVAFYP